MNLILYVFSDQGFLKNIFDRNLVKIEKTSTFWDIVLLQISKTTRPIDMITAALKLKYINFRTKPCVTLQI